MAENIQSGDVIEDAYGNPAMVTGVAQIYAQITMLCGSDRGRSASVRLSTARRITDQARIDWARKIAASLSR